MGEGLLTPHILSPDLIYTVPAGKSARLVYFRAGNASSHLLYLSVLRDGKPARYFPIAPQGDSHVELAIQEEIPSGTQIEIAFASGEGVFGTVVLDVGFLEWATP
jgi:hypothetical protein